MAALTDKRALITGGASGLGLAIAIDGGFTASMI